MMKFRHFRAGALLAASALPFAAQVQVDSKLPEYEPVCRIFGNISI